MAAEVERVNSLYDEYEAFTIRLRIDSNVVPLNLNDERRRFLENFVQNGTIRDPRFEYEPMDHNRPAALEDLRGFAERVEPDRSLAAARLAESIQQQFGVMAEDDLHDADSVTSRTSRLFGTPSNELVSDALDVLGSAERDHSAATVSAVDAAARLTDVLQALAFTQWVVEVSDRMSARMSVNGSMRRIRVRADAQFDEAEVRRLAIHEIGTHVARFEAGADQTARFLRIGSADYLVWEEGLAAFNEKRWGVATTKSFSTYAARVVASSVALREGFSAVVEALIEWMPADEAFDIAVRAKRGFTDVGRTGAHVKDIVYFQGYNMVADKAVGGEPDRRLEMGKVSFTDLPLLEILENAGLASAPSVSSADVARLFED
jgi:hypothetical protein